MDENIKKWIEAMAMRAVKTGAEVALAGIGTSTFVTDVHWVGIASMVALSMIASVLASVNGLPEVGGGASVAKIARGGDQDA